MLATAALYENFLAPLASLGPHPRYTPISTHGPMCQGSLISHSTIAAHKLAAVGHLRLGAKALQTPVLSLNNRSDQRRRRAGNVNNDPPDSYALRGDPCPLCNVEPLDPYHLAIECPDITLCNWRESAQSEARRLLLNIARILRAAHDEAGHDVSDLCARVSNEALALDVTTDAGQFMLFRLLICHPWSARVAEGDLALYPAAVVGELFDCEGMPNMLLRQLANTWGYWSITWAWRLGAAWRAAYRLLYP
jgi:hypothetical protein